MKKKIASLLLTLTLCLGLYPAALAAEPEPALYYVEASQDYVEVSTQTAVDGKEYPLFIYPAGTTFAFGEQSQGVSALVLMVWKFSTLEAGASFYDPDFTTGPVENKVFTPEPGVVYLLEETNTVDSFRDTYIMVQSGTPAETPADGGEQVPDETAANPFTDVPESAYYYAPVQWAVAQGITAGRTETTFAPGENCTRANIVTFLWRAAGSPEPTLTEQQFMDVSDPGAYYYKAVQWAAEMDMWSFGTFAPNDPCDRLTGGCTSCGVPPEARRWRASCPSPTCPSGTGTTADSPSISTRTRRCCGLWKTASPPARRRPPLRPVRSAPGGTL